MSNREGGESPRPLARILTQTFIGRKSMSLILSIANVILSAVILVIAVRIYRESRKG